VTPERQKNYPSSCTSRVGGTRASEHDLLGTWFLLPGRFIQLTPQSLLNAELWGAAAKMPYQTTTKKVESKELRRNFSLRRRTWGCWGVKSWP